MARYVESHRWVPLKHAIKLGRTFGGEEEYRIYGEDLYTDPCSHLTQSWFDDALSCPGWSRYYALPTPVTYEHGKRLWVSPDGWIYYAAEQDPEQDRKAIKICLIVKKFRTGYRVDLGEVEREIKKISRGNRTPSGGSSVLRDIQVLCLYIDFCKTYNLDPEKMSMEVEEAMPCLDDRERMILEFCGYQGGNGHPWRHVPPGCNLSRAGVFKVYHGAVRKIQRRIRSNRVRKSFGLLPQQSQATTR
jgi:hypothetical protein